MKNRSFLAKATLQASDYIYLFINPGNNKTIKLLGGSQESEP